MTIVGDRPTGYRTVQHGHDIARWQHRLYAEIRRAPVYKGLVDEARSKRGPVVARPDSFRDPAFWRDPGLDPASPYFRALELAVRGLCLTRNGRPCPWAIQHLHEDVEGRFDPDRPPRAMSRAVRRVVEVSASPASMRVTVRTPGQMTTPPPGMPNPSTCRIVGAIGEESGPLPALPMQVSATDWGELESRAVEATRQAVAELREALTRPTGSDFHDRKPIKAGNDPGRELQIERLALRLTGRAGPRNDPRTDRHWFARLGIDRPPSKRQVLG